MQSDRSVKFDNDLLRFSLIQDLKSMDDLNHVILEENCLIANSWLHPNQTYQPDNILEMKTESDEDYTNCLEMLIDRMYSILGAFLNIFDGTKGAQTDMYKNVMKPQKLTLSLITTALYERIHDLGIRKEDNKLHKIQPPQDVTVSSVEISENLDKETQVNIKIVQCPRCVIAQRCIKSVAEQLAKVGNDGYVTRAKEKLKSVIFRSTQEESLDLLTNAINKDVKDLIEHNKQQQTKLNDVERELDANEISHQASLDKISELENGVRELDEWRETEVQKQSILHNIINKLFRDKKKLERDTKQDKEQVKQLEGVIEGQTSNIRNLHEELDTFRANNKHLLSQEEMLNAEKDLWKIRFDRTQEENKKVKKQNKELRSNLRQINDTVCSIESNFVGLEKNISESCAVIETNSEDYEELFNRIEDVVKSSAILEDKLNCYAQNEKSITCTVPRPTNITTEDMEVKGDPLLDMMKQIECNNKNIAMMKQQNEVLLKTIQKFQECRLHNHK